MPNLWISLKMRHLTKLRQQLEFARHIPLKQFARRIQLVLKKKFFRHSTYSKNTNLSSIGHVSLSPLPIVDLIPPHGYLKPVDNDWEACFLGEKVVMKNTIEWIPSARSVSNQLWRMNLHYFEFLPSLDTKSAEIVISDWIDKCGPTKANALSNEWNSYSISLRISAWLNYYSKNGAFGSESFQIKFAQSIEQQSNFLLTFLETDIQGNHIIKNIRALYESAYCLPSDNKLNWIATAKSLLTDQLNRQILTDGYHFELSPSYHIQVLTDLTSIHSTMHTGALQTSLQVIITKMTQAMIDTCHPDGFPAQFGDSGLSMTLAPTSYLATFTQNFKGQNLSTNRYINYSDAGYFGYRSASSFLIIKTGKLGPDELMAHAHADWGSFEWSINKKRIIVDQGVYEYVPGYRRDKSRATSSHNTVQFDNTEQAAFIGAFRCSYRPKKCTTNFERKNDGFTLKSALKRSKLIPCDVIREMEFRDLDELIITDSITSNSGLIRNSFLLHPKCEAVQISPTELEFTRECDVKVKMYVEAGVIISLEPAVWWPNMGHEENTHRIRTQIEGQSLTVRMRTVDTNG